MNSDSDVYGPSHGEIRELLGAYALHAVPEDERRAVENHLASCRVCRVEVEEHRSTAAMLAATGAPAPRGLWDRIAGAIEAAPPVDHRAAREAPRHGRRRPGAFARWAAAAAAAVAVLAIVGLGLKVVQQDRVLDRLVATSEERGLVQAANAALLDPGASRITLSSEERGVVVDAVFLPNGTGYLVRNNLRPLPAGRTYQLWALDEGIPISLGVLGRQPGVVAFSVDPRVGGLAITEERSGGVVSTENDPVVMAEVQTT
jgi:anti-sigma-K factor RskA